MSIVITGGGTGGHLAICKALAKEFGKRGIEVIFIGSTNGQDKMWFEDSTLFYKKYFLQSSGVVDKKNFSKLLSLLKIIKLSKKCKDIFKTHDVKGVVSVGGYSGAPASLAAIYSFIPFFIHEQNATIGKLNKLLKPFSKGFYSSYFKPKFDYPVDVVFFQNSRIRKELKTVIFLGGSQGATFINALAMMLALKFKKDGIAIIHQCGQKEFEFVREFYKKHDIKAEIFTFSKDIVSYMKKADLCIGRSGASTLWELCAMRLPAVFIPFPHAANNHQYTNAKFLQEKSLAKLFIQKEISLEGFKEILDEDSFKRLLKDSSGKACIGLNEIYDEIKKFDINYASSKLEEIISIGGAEKIVDDIVSKV